ncbi:MAG TPA: phage holin family protein [Usitatibacter sp.]|nr:phage holin family protein [Usitatibacter sp.]
MLTLLARWIVNAAALLLVAYLYPGVQVTGFLPALVAALVLGLVNAVIRPILVILTLPVTLLTLGLFLFVINALMFWLAASIVHGFTVTGFGAALLGSILYSLITLVTSWLLFPRPR